MSFSKGLYPTSETEGSKEGLHTASWKAKALGYRGVESLNPLLRVTPLFSLEYAPDGDSDAIRGRSVLSVYGKSQDQIKLPVFPRSSLA